MAGGLTSLSATGLLWFGRNISGLWDIGLHSQKSEHTTFIYNTLIFQVITLNKGDKGLGFSILDYQDPLNMSETVIVVRSLVPGGIAQLDGQIVPGDRILHVNQVRLEHVSLDTAVQALKGKVKEI